MNVTEKQPIGTPRAQAISGSNFPGRAAAAAAAQCGGGPPNRVARRCKRAAGRRAEKRTSVRKMENAVSARNGIAPLQPAWPCRHPMNRDLRPPADGGSMRLPRSAPAAHEAWSGGLAVTSRPCMSKSCSNGRDAPSLPTTQGRRGRESKMADNACGRRPNGSERGMPRTALHDSGARRAGASKGPVRDARRSCCRERVRSYPRRSP